jgi:hypothetical protein
MLTVRQKQLVLERTGLVEKRGELDDELKILIDRRVRALATSETAQRE